MSKPKIYDSIFDHSRVYVTVGGGVIFHNNCDNLVIKIKF